MNKTETQLERDIKAVFFGKEYPQRTGQQNRALHLAFRILADELNAAGLDQRVVLNPSIHIPWDEKAIKERLWRPIQKVMLFKESTTELDTTEITQVWDLIMRELGEKFEVEYIPFPSEEQTESYLKSLKP